MQYDNFGKFLRTKREALGVSLNRFALENEIDSAALSRIETQKQGISLSAIAKIANGYGIAVSSLIKEFEIWKDSTIRNI